MGFRDDELAGRARVDALEQEVARLEAENAALKSPAQVPERRRSGVARLTPVALAIAVLAVAGAALAPLPAAGRMVLVMMAVIALMSAILLTFVSRLLHVVGPGEALVLSGVQRPGPDGTRRGYRIVTGGRVMQVPLLETATWMALGPFPLSLELRGVHARREPVDLRASAAIEIARDPATMPNAVERFLGRPADDIREVARQTLEGALRAVVAELSLPELQEDTTEVQERFRAEVEEDLEKLGLALTSFVIESVTQA